jgi:FkbM family methyltransferase
MNRLAQHLSVGQLVALAQHAVYSVYHRVTRLNYERELYAVRKRVSGETFRSFDPLALHVRDPLLGCLLSNFAPDDVFVDVGANTGVYALSVAANYPSCSITAFEPDPIVFSRLETNVRMNGFDACIDAYEMGLGARAETRPFHRSTYPELGSFNRPAAARWGATVRETCSVPVRPLDTLVAQGLSPPDHLKIDVEGFGLAVLAGARETIDVHRPIIYFEPHPVAEDADRVQEMQAFFDRFDYRIESHDNAWFCTPI